MIKTLAPIFLLSLLTLLSAPLLSVAATSDDASASSAFEDCTIGDNGTQIAALCATLDVPLDPDDPSGERQSLSVAKIEARRRSGHSDAVTLIAGGPGQSAIESFPALTFAFRHIMRDRDVILIDQRGTGQSTPLDCEEDSVSNLDGGANLAIDPDELAQQAQACLDTLPADPRLFTTSIAVQDLENIRQQLGISQWNLYGVSYGTRVAAHYLRRYPEAVRSVILDAVLPPQVALGPDISRLAQQSLEHIYNRCDDSPGCKEKFGNLTEPTLLFLDELENNPQTITYENIATGELSGRQFSRDDLAATLRMLTYSSQTAAIVPSMMFDAIENGNLAPLARQADIQSTSLGGMLATGMHHAVICTEDVPYFSDALSIDNPADNAVSQNTSGDATQLDPATSRSYLGEGVIESIVATCQHWPAGRIDADFKEPLQSDTPILILSGGADPITPPAYGEIMMSELTNARHIINEEEGHMQAAFGCMPALMAQFVETTDTDSLDVECLQRLQTTPFFIDANGPLP